jgi:hypothetical protein
MDWRRERSIIEARLAYLNCEYWLATGYYITCSAVVYLDIATMTKIIPAFFT